MTHRGSKPPNLLEAPARSIRTVFPIAEWLPRYRWRRDLGADVVAGVSVSALLVPESLGYAGVAGVPPEFGLYAALGALLAYALTGGVSILVVGPASAVAALSASLVADLGGADDPLAVTSALAITSGLLFLAAGAARLGWIVHFISRPVLDAFVAGLSIAIIIGQLDELTGAEGGGGSAVAKLEDLVSAVGDWHGLTVALGIAVIVSLLVMEHLVARLPAALVVVATAVVLVRVFDLDGEGIALVGDIPRGLPDVAVPDLGAVRWLELLGAGTALLLVGYSEGYAAAVAVSADTGEKVDPDQELVATGGANLAAGLLGGMAVGGSLSKSAESRGAGARTQMANLVSAAIVLATLVFLAPVFEDLPETVLAAVVIVAVLPSADPRTVWRVRQVNSIDFAAAAATFVLVLVWETLPALVVGVVLSLAFLVRRASFPDVVPLRRDATGAFRADGPGPLGGDDPLVLRFEGPLVYASAERLILAARAMLELDHAATCLVLDAEMVSDLDTTGAAALVELDDELDAAGVVLHLAAVHHRARAQMQRSKLLDRFGARMHPTVESAAGACRPSEAT